jgi:hypothetical protein
MRRMLPLLLAAVLLAAACSGSDAPPQARSTVTAVRPDADVPPALAQFVDGVAEPGSIPFRATYQVLNKLGGQETNVDVVADPPSWQVRIGDLVVVDGSKRATCRTSKRRCVGEIRDELLAPTGVFSRFFASAPARALATDARRSTAGAPQLSSRTVAGIDLHCAAVPISGAIASTYCLTPEGVFGYVDTPAVHYELTSYAPGSPGEPGGVPYPIVTDRRFLTAD